MSTKPLLDWLMERGSMNKKSKFKGCESCSNLIPIGEGDHICNECGDMPAMVISDYVPTDEYMKCGGRRYET